MSKTPNAPSRQIVLSGNDLELYSHLALVANADLHGMAQFGTWSAELDLSGETKAELACYTLCSLPVFRSDALTTRISFWLKGAMATLKAMDTNVG